MTKAIVCVGHASVDHHFEVQAFSPLPTKTPASSYAQLAGGMAANAAMALARLGVPVRLLGRVGDDAAGQFVCQALSERGVAHQLEVVRGAQTSVSSVVVDARGERHIFNHKGSALALAHALDTAQLQGAKAILTDPRWAAGAQAALTWAREQGVLSMLDADIAPTEVLQTLVPLAQWTVFSEKGLACFAPDLPTQAALQAALDVGVQVAMVTQGERGAYWLSPSDAHHLQHVSAYPVQAQDTTGAGDVFHAALLFALTQGQSIETATHYAAAAAAIKCTRKHGLSGAPMQDEVLAFLREHASAPSRHASRQVRYVGV